MTRTISIASLVVAGIFTAAVPVRAADHLRVAKPSAIGFGFSLLDVGVAAGIFKSHDLDVEAIVFDGSAKEHLAMAAGAVDVTLGAGTDLAFVAKGVPEKGVAAIAGPPLNFGAMAGNDGKIKTVADLKGKSISASTIGSTTYWFANQISVREGWTGADAMTIVPLGSFDAARAALKTGNIDAISATIEGALVLEKEHAGKLILAYGDLIKPFLNHVAFASDDLMKTHPDSLRRFLKAWFETVAWMKAHKDEGLRYSMVATSLPPDIASKVFDIEMPMFLADGHFDRAAVAVVMNSLVDTGSLASIPDNDMIFTENYLN